MKRIFDVSSAQAMVALGQLLRGIEMLNVIYISGDLGAGKTTLVRGILAGLGLSGPVKSPTFTLVETYTYKSAEIYHFDLYRIEDPRELDFIGLEDYFQDSHLCLIEWPERGEGVLPAPDAEIAIQINEQGRRVVIETQSAGGEKWLKGLEGAL